MFKKNFSLVFCATIFAAFGLASCGGGNEGGGGGGINTDTVTTTNTGTPTNTTTDTTTGTPTDTTTGTNTGTAVTVPSWFKVKDLGGQLILDNGVIYGNVDIFSPTVHADGTWTANVTCDGQCGGVGYAWSGTISETAFTVKNIGAVGMIPAAPPAPSTANTSGKWNFSDLSGTFYF